MNAPQKNLLEAVQDPERLRVLKSLELLDTEAEEAFDRLTRLASRITNSPTALISLVDEDRQFFKSLLGLPEEIVLSRETPLSHSFCKHVVADEAPLIVEDAHRSSKVAGNLAIHDLDVVAYLGFPLATKGGVMLGSMCVIDNKPRRWSQEDISAVRELAMLTMTEIELRAQVKARQKAEQEHELLLNMIIHDLRNPLFVIKGSLELLELSVENPQLGPINKEFIEQSSVATHELNGLIDDLLNFNKLEAGALQIIPRETNISEFVFKREKMYQLRAQIEKLMFAVRLEPNLPLINIDRNLISRVLDNLISNAIKYSDESGVVEFSAERYDNSFVSFSVCDQGVGVPEAYRETIFEKYVQVTDDKGRPLRKGTGIGLAYCKQVVELHNGRIWVESAQGQGSCFLFTLPIADDQDN